MRASRRVRRTASSRAANRTVLFLLSALLLSAASPPTELSSDHLAWLELVEPIITAEERRAFSSLQRTYQRDAFIARFWQQRDPRPDTGSNEFLADWSHRADTARELFGDLDNDRSRTMLLIGLPKLMLPDLCPELLRPVEAWYYGETDEHPDGFYLVFTRPAADPQLSPKRWSPLQGLDSLWREDLDRSSPSRSADAAWRCTRGRQAEAALTGAVGWEQIRTLEPFLPPDPGDWVGEFLDRTTDLDADAAAMTAAMQLRFPGRLEERTVVEVEITIPSEVATTSGREEEVYRLRIDGEVLRRDTLFDQFRFDFEMPADDVLDREIPLAFQRELLPGDYTLVLKLDDRNSGHAFRSEGPLHVPTPDQIQDAFGSPLTEANAVLAHSDHRVKIRPLPEQLLTGRVRVEAETLGDDIAKVTFVLNDRRLMSKTRPPYSLEIDLGRAPRLHWLEAIAVDSAGVELARDRIPVNAGPHRFSVRLVEPRSGERYVSSLRAAAEVHLPAGEELDRVDFYLNEDRLASLYQPPFVQPLRLPQSQRITYVRAVAYLIDGNATEDLVFINAPSDMAHLRINMVELFTTVHDGKGNPIEGLTAADFLVREEGEEQKVRRFERVQDLSVHAGVILDASTSMREEIDQAVDAALQFFEAVIEPKDRAAVLVFHDQPDLKVPLTNRLEVLAEGLEGVESQGETALYDTVVYALHYFAGIRGKRALVLLSDGEDSRSRFSFAETLEFAQRSGVAIYTIALGLDRRQPEARSVLVRLARETGGHFFAITSVRELKSIYRRIERELRSQYLLAYQSTHEQGGEFRRVEVQVGRKGLKAKTIPGYYP